MVSDQKLYPKADVMRRPPGLARGRGFKKLITCLSKISHRLHEASDVASGGMRSTAFPCFRFGVDRLDLAPTRSCGECAGDTKSRTERTDMVITPGATTDDGISESMPYKLNNYAATAAPGAGDDSEDGYEIGSLWINTTATPREAYQCVDATEGAAVWVNISLEIGEVHVQGTDQGLDTGGANAVTAAQVKTAVTNTHAAGSDNQSLAALATKVPVDPVPTGKVAVFDATGNIAVATPGLHVADGVAVSGTATTGGFGFVTAEEMNLFISGVNGLKDAVNAVIARLEAKGIIAGS